MLSCVLLVVGGLLVREMQRASTAPRIAFENVAAMDVALDEFGIHGDAAREYWRGRRPSLTADAIEQRVAESLRLSADGRITWRYDARGIASTRLNPDPARIVDLWPIVERLSVPTLILRGASSDFCPGETVAEMCRRNPRIESVEIPAAGHYVHDDNPTAFNAHVTGFLLRL